MAKKIEYQMLDINTVRISALMKPDSATPTDGGRSSTRSCVSSTRIWYSPSAWR